MKPVKGAGLLAAAGLVIAVAWLVGSSLPRPAEADSQPSRNCAMDPLNQSICIYEAILADIARTYPHRGGGGISSIVQKSTTSFTVQIAQEGRSDLLIYEIEVGEDGKVKIAGKEESTQSY